MQILANKMLINTKLNQSFNGFNQNVNFDSFIKHANYQIEQINIFKVYLSENKYIPELLG